MMKSQLLKRFIQKINVSLNNVHIKKMKIVLKLKLRNQKTQITI